jgi:septal ring factor EnvC (AmiA/AmiB activator)
MLLDGLKKIETKEELLTWAKFINNNPVIIKQKCDLQDIWAHSNQQTLNDLFMDGSSETRKLVLFGVYKTMSYDEVERLLLYFAKARGMEIVNREITAQQKELDESRTALWKREQIFKECKKSYFKRMRDLKAENERLKRNSTTHTAAVENYRERLRAQQNELNECRTKAAKYDTLKQALT